MTSALLASDASEFLNSLNPPQRQAVETLDGPVLVLAGAGTGKTRVLTTRIAHLLRQKQAWPSQVLAVTFTNKAAREMKERVHHLLGDSGIDISGLWLGTFHSIAARILRRHAEALGFNPSFSILDMDDQIRLIKQILSELNIDDKKTPARTFSAIIQGFKDKAITPEKCRGLPGADYAGGMCGQVYQLYQQRLRTLNAMDFGDLLMLNIELFANHREILAEYATRFRYILVDEYQDTNVAQYLWLRLLAQGHKNICCVGDDDQSIYGWRGAEVGNILKFEQDFPGAAVIRLEQNYRSTSHILGAASGLIAKNEGRLGKTLWTAEDGGEKIRLRSVWDEAEEARQIGEDIEQFQRERVSLNDMAILVRAGFQTRPFEERLMTLGIRYRVIGGLRFYERQEIRDAVAYIRVLAQKQDDLALERIINLPKRGIGASTLELLHTTARGRDTSLYEAVEHLLQTSGFKGKMQATLHALLAQFDRWRERLREAPLAEVAEQMLDESGYREMWKQEKTPDAQGRLDNLRELIRALQEFPTVTEFLEHVGLVMDREGDNSGEMVNLMTLHAAKGLEFDVVFLPGWEEGLFPSQRSMDELGRQGLEEERRLAYVGITRARKHLILSHAGRRRIYNQWQHSLPSRFLAEIPPEHIESPPPSGMRTYALSNPSSFNAEIDAILKQPGFTPKPKAVEAPDTPFPSGTRVVHPKFGQGRVVGVQGDKLDVAFEKEGLKKVLADYVKKA